MVENNAPVKFRPLLRQAEDLIKSNPSAEEAVVVLAAKGNVRSFLNRNIMSGDTTDETAFVKTLSESGDTKVLCAVCMWADGTPDVPSFHLRTLLKDLDPANLETGFLLNGSRGLNVKPMRVMFPSKK